MRWWSKWARLRRRGDEYLLTSEELPEPFFNRAGALTCKGGMRAARWAERAFSRAGINPTVTIFESCRATSSLLSSGYTMVDRMSVFESKGPVADGGGEARTVASGDPKRWADAYLDSFYGGRALEGVVTSIAARLLEDKGATLFESSVNGTAAGVMALFRTPGLLGLYCLGTVPAHRGRGVATGLLGRAASIARMERRKLILQTLVSDGAAEFYRRRGFSEMYSKLVLERRLNAHPRRRP